MDEKMTFRLKIILPNVVPGLAESQYQGQGLSTTTCDFSYQFRQFLLSQNKPKT
jgi:hypothetical protein